MRRNPMALLQSFGKLLGVVLAAGLAGAGVGVGLAQLSGGGGAKPDPTTPAVSTTEQATAPTIATATQTQTVAPRRFLVPRVQVLSARLGEADGTTGRGRLDVRVRVTNRTGRPLAVATPVLVSRTDEVLLDSRATRAARPLLGILEPGARATGRLRFTTSSAITTRLRSALRARLRIARRTVALTLTPSSPAAPPG